MGSLADDFDDPLDHIVPGAVAGPGGGHPARLECPETRGARGRDLHLHHPDRPAASVSGHPAVERIAVVITVVPFRYLIVEPAVAALPRSLKAWWRCRAGDLHVEGLVTPRRAETVLVWLVAVVL